MSQSVYDNWHIFGTNTPHGAPLAEIPAALRDLTRWVVRKGKVPHQARNPRYGASSTNPDHWSDLATALQAVQRGQADGIGSVITDDLGMVFVDLDNCFDDDGQLKPYAAEIVRSMHTHWHISMSGRGLHGLCYGQIPAAMKDSAAGIEMYSTERYVAWPSNPQIFGEHREITDCSAAVTALYDRYRGNQASAQAAVNPAVVSMDTRDVIDRLEARQKAVRLLSGDAGDYPGFSEARFALASLTCFWTDDPVIIAEVLISSQLFKPEHEPRERERRALLDARNALTTYTGPRYDPNYYRPDTTGHGTPSDPELESLSPDELRAIIRRQTARIEAERAARIEAERRAERAELERSRTVWILRNEDLPLGERVTGFALATELQARVSNGETPKESGYRVPAARLAEMTGQSPQTVARHMRALDKKGVITKHVIREATELEEVDSDGVITTVPGMRDANYVEVPEGNVINLIDRMQTYQRPDGSSQHGGKREARPACENHPEAGTYTVRHEHVECAECHVVLLESEPTRTYHAPDPSDETSDIILIPDNTTVVNTYSDIKMTPETGTDSRFGASGIKMVSVSPGDDLEVSA